MTVRVVNTAYGRVLMPDTEAGFRFTSGSGVYEEHIYIEKVLTLLQGREPGVIVDAGANYGFWSLALAPLATQLIAIEPQRGIYHMLCGTIALNDFTYRIFPHQIAVGERARQDKIAILDHNKPGMFGGLSLGDEPHPAFEAPFEVIGWEPIQVVTLDDCLDPSLPIMFIKMDIEGSEKLALLGAIETITKWRPPMFVECEHSKTDTESLRHQIWALDYQVQDLKRNFLCLPR